MTIAVLLSVVAMAWPARPPHEPLWQCIHKREARWTDDHAPYWGGLQMGQWFHDTYARRLTRLHGHANRWPALTQMWVAENAYRRESYSRAWLRGQWPNTSPPCWRFA